MKDSNNVVLELDKDRFSDYCNERGFPIVEDGLYLIGPEKFARAFSDFEEKTFFFDDNNPTTTPIPIAICVTYRNGNFFVMGAMFEPGKIVPIEVKVAQ